MEKPVTSQPLSDPCYHDATLSTPIASRRVKGRTYQKSGAYTLKRAIRTLGSRTIDRRTRIGKALAEWADALATDLGGLDALSTSQKALIEQAATTRLLLDSIDAWLVRQPSLVDRRKRALLPVVRERQALADALVRYLSALGLERKARDVTDLASYLASRTTPTRASLGSPVTTLVAASEPETATSRDERPPKGAIERAERQKNAVASFMAWSEPVQPTEETRGAESATSRHEQPPKAANHTEERQSDNLASFDGASDSSTYETEPASPAERATPRVAEVQP